MRGSLGVRVNDGRTDRMVTSKTRSLRFRKTAPGGHHSASCNLLLPRDTFPSLGPADRLYVYDAVTGATVWEGYTENPGALDGPSGQGFDLSAMGGIVLASDRAERLIYLDRSYDAWRRDDSSGVVQAASAETGVDSFPDTGNPALRCQFNPGQPVTSGSQARMIYDAFKGSLMTLGGFRMTSKGGQTDANYNMQWVYGATVIASRSQITTGALTAGFAVTDFASGFDNLAVRLYRQAGGATNVATDNVWAGFGGPRILGQRMDRNGTLLTLAEATYVLASDVVEDLLGRVLTECDPSTSTIDATTTQIDQLVYLDAATAADVLDDLALHEPDFHWGIGASTANGHTFWYRAWPTTPRYEISTADGYSAPGGDVDLCNRVTVNWTDEKGTSQTTVVTSTVAELGTRIRDADSVSLPEGRGSAANAQRIGEQILAGKNHPPRAATAVVRRPIVDHLRGMLVMPWEIEPGYVVRVRETGDDLRLTEMEYVDDDCAATLTLGTPVLSQEQILAKLGRAA